MERSGEQRPFYLWHPLSIIMEQNQEREIPLCCPVLQFFPSPPVPPPPRDLINHFLEESNMGLLARKGGASPSLSFQDA